MDRTSVVKLARSIVRDVEKGAYLPAGARVVVVVTGEDGDFVGVAGNTPDPDVQAILWHALNGGDREYLSDAIDMPPEAG